MANAREIKLRIKGINETKKITKAMKLIAAVKLKKARVVHEATMPFFKHIQETMSDILERLPNIESIYFDKREKKENRKKAYIVITSDRGLTGSYNHNVIKYACKLINKENSIVFPIGNTVKNHMIRNNYTVDTSLQNIFIEVDTQTSGKITTYMLDLFKEGKIDELNLIYTEMESAMSLIPHSINLLPLERKDFKRKENKILETLELEPSAEIVFEVLANKYIKGILYGGMVESFVSEQFARMTAMDNSTTNAEKMITKLTLNYNRARQAAITQEISEIIAGATYI